MTTVHACPRPEPAGLGARALHRACAAVAWGVLHPARKPPVFTPAAVGLPYRRVRLHSPGARLAAWHIPHPTARAGIVLCHGHNDSRSQFLRMLRPLHEAGFHLLLSDFRTMGVSSGGVCTYGHEEQQDVLAGVDWLRAEAGVEQVGLFGLSMGGATALLAAAADPAIGAVVTECAFARLDEMIERKFCYLPRRLRAPISRGVRHWSEHWAGVSVADVDPEGAVRRWRPRPLLVIHAERDLLVPVDHARRLAEAGGDPAELWIVPRVGHVGCRRGARGDYERRVPRFFQTHLQAR